MAKKQVAKKQAKPKNDAMSFEESLEQLEIIVRELESGEMGLNDALTQYEQGVRYLKHCHQALRSAETKIEMLTRIDPDGNAESTPFEDADPDESLGQKQTRRGERRSVRPSPPSESGELF